ncbi:MAG TPA: Yip1 family protein, partial [Candidatus Acidoferrum sp.]|nr:Yip1 family protein [Candidatus Acidoferrum sp.]
MATTTVGAPDSAPPPQGPINHFGRIVGVFFSPKKTFEDVVQRPSWIAPVVLMSVLGLVVGFVMNQKINWRDVASKRIEESPRAAQLSPEQKEQQLNVSEKISRPIAYGIGLFGPILAVVIVGGVMLLAYNLLGGANANFKVSMAIVSHAYVVTLISSLLFILVLYLREPGTIDLDNPVATNLGAFFPDGTAKWLEKLGSAIDVFSFWVLYLIALGYSAFNPRKLKLGGSIGIGLAVWAAYEVCRVGIS